MPRPLKNRLIMRSMCARLSALMDFIGDSDSEFSKKLGYSNPTTISRMRQGQSFVDSERLAKIGAMNIHRKKVTPNLHWILTGTGNPVISESEKEYADAVSIAIKNNVKLR